MNFSSDQYRKITQLIVETLKKQSRFPQLFETHFNWYKKLNYRNMSDGEIFWELVQVVFYSGMKAATVSRRLPSIKKYLGDYKTVKNYTNIEVNEIMNDPNTIHHLKKIHACIKNARQFESVLDKYGSFRNYLDQFDPFDENKLNDLKFDLMKRFEFLGGITVFHFLTNLGFNVLKPDRVVCRVFERLGLISDRNDIYKAVEVGKKFSEATGYPIRCIDIIFAKYGQMGKDLFMGEPVFGLEDGICFEKNPKCFVCGVKSFCRGC